jgi:pyruvate dehydrogenase E1 component beta subunit
MRSAAFHSTKAANAKMTVRESIASAMSDEMRRD